MKNIIATLATSRATWETRESLARNVDSHFPKKKPATCVGSGLLTVEAIFGELVSGSNSLHQRLSQAISRAIVRLRMLAPLPDGEADQMMCGVLKKAAR